MWRYLRSWLLSHRSVGPKEDKQAEAVSVTKHKIQLTLLMSNNEHFGTFIAF